MNKAEEYLGFTIEREEIGRYGGRYQYRCGSFVAPTKKLVKSEIERLLIKMKELGLTYEDHHQSRVNAISDEAKKEFFKRLDNMNQNEFDSYSLTDHIENFITLLNK